MPGRWGPHPRSYFHGGDCTRVSGVAWFFANVAAGASFRSGGREEEEEVRSLFGGSAASSGAGHVFNPPQYRFLFNIFH